ncbi:hypothetical protein [Chryseobacterium sp. JK1]|uniref:hypothetical protein n=1 Tax=Chryseobacterium sp. JK1 TaxID=874294 RepID=UPI003D69D730
MENKIYTESDLVSFGNYLLSPKRKERIEGEEKAVYHADLENWKVKEVEGAFRLGVEEINNILLKSCPEYVNPSDWAEWVQKAKHEQSNGSA